MIFFRCFSSFTFHNIRFVQFSLIGRATPSCEQYDWVNINTEQPKPFAQCLWAIINFVKPADRFVIKSVPIQSSIKTHTEGGRSCLYFQTGFFVISLSKSPLS
jgi:hypothetical protein